MTKKPSERITDIYKELLPPNDILPKVDILLMQIQAILNYLDEQWEKNQPCSNRYEWWRSNR